MRRRVLIKLGVFLLLGAVVNIAVAWGLAVSDPAEPRDGFWRQIGGDYTFQWQDWYRVRFYVKRAFGRARGFGSWSGAVQKFSPVLPEPLPASALELIAPRWALPVLPQPTDSKGSFCWRIVDLRGWPCLCLESRFESRSDTPDGADVLKVNHCVHLPDRPRQLPWDYAAPRLLPLKPRFPGFAINTIFYAAIIWMLFAAPFALRRRVRIRRGLCPRCAYPMGGSDVCTECGVALPARRARG